MVSDIMVFKFPAGSAALWTFQFFDGNNRIQFGGQVRGPDIRNTR